MPLQKYGLHLKNVGKNQDVKNKPMLKSGEKVVIQTDVRLTPQFYKALSGLTVSPKNL